MSFYDEEAVFDWVPVQGLILKPGMHVHGFSGVYADIKGIITEVTDTDVTLELKNATMMLNQRTLAAAFLVRMPPREDIEQPHEPTKH